MIQNISSFLGPFWSTVVVLLVGIPLGIFVVVAAITAAFSALKRGLESLVMAATPAPEVEVVEHHFPQGKLLLENNMIPGLCRVRVVFNSAVLGCNEHELESSEAWTHPSQIGERKLAVMKRVTEILQMHGKMVAAAPAAPAAPAPAAPAAPAVTPGKVSELIVDLPQGKLRLVNTASGVCRGFITLKAPYMGQTLIELPKAFKSWSSPSEAAAIKWQAMQLVQRMLNPATSPRPKGGGKRVKVP